MIRWATKASAYRVKVGIRVTVGCPAGGQRTNIWGTGEYTDDSSICTAAVHAGFITVARGGVVTLEIQSGKASYTGSTQHGVTSGTWAHWGRGFMFVGSARPLPLRTRLRPTGPQTIPWSKTARNLRPQVGKRFTYRCAGPGRLSAVWGSSIYTDDSSICSAAVHAGYITLTRGGTVTLQVQSGQSAYQGSLRNGVKSSSWRSWTGSFIFVVPVIPCRP